jgi:hypothetical protein
MPAPLSDPQRDAIYSVESEFSGAWKYARTSRELLEGLITQVGNYYGIAVTHHPVLKIVQRLKGGHAGEQWADDIRLSREGDGQNPMVLLHELAHWLVDELYGDTVEDHGPEFAAIQMHLFDKWSIIPHQCYRLLAKKYRVKLARRYRPIAFK